MPLPALRSRIVLTLMAAAALTITSVPAAADTPNDSATANGAVAAYGGTPCAPAACIDNGTIFLAVNPTGELSTHDAAGTKVGPRPAGITYLPTGNDAIAPGCLCEGWGIADPASRVSGGAYQEDYPAGRGLTVESFTQDADSAKSVVLVGDPANPTFRVTHDFVPSPVTPNLYQATVTIENLTASEISSVLYRRILDWDVEPTAFNEYVTIDGGTATNLVYTSDDGFAPADPLAGPSKILFEGNAVDSGPADHGALFDFDFGPVAAGHSVTFRTYFGAAGDEAGMRDALAAVGAEAYSLAKSFVDREFGTPNTFAFAFGQVGGAPIFPAPSVLPPVTPVVPNPSQPAAIEDPAAVEPAAVRLADTGSALDPLPWIGGIVLLGAAGAVLILRAKRRRQPA